MCKSSQIYSFYNLDQKTWSNTSVKILYEWGLIASLGLDDAIFQSDKNAQNAKFPAWPRLKHGKNRENVVFWSANPLAIHQKLLSLSWVTPMVCFSCVHLEKSRRSFKVGSVKQPFNKALSSILSGFQPARRGLFYWHKRPLPLGS